MKKLLVLMVMLLTFSCRFRQENRAISKVSNLPSFQILLLDSATILSTNEIAAGGPIILMYFRPDCIHCHRETEVLLNNIDTLKGTRIYLLCGGASLEDIKQFSKYFHLAQYKNITVGEDFDHSFYQMYRPSFLPYMVIYDTQQKLVKIFQQEVPIRSIIAAIKS